MIESLLSTAPSWGHFLTYFLIAVILLNIVLGFVTFAILAERKVTAVMQLRVGPNQLGGRFGLLQTVADVLKLLLKEDIVPYKADKLMFIWAPVIAFFPSFTILAAIPFTDTVYFADMNVGLLYILALTSVTSLGVMAAGWASNNKYSILGAMRGAAQMISYEVPLLISVVGIILIAGSLNLRDIVEAQSSVWFLVMQPLAFVIFVIAAVAELNRVPFDLPEAESELVAGYHTEFTGFRYAILMLTEYVYMFAFSALGVVLFFGGWLPPLQWVPGLDFLAAVPGSIWFALKFMFVVFFLVWLRATLPRVRADHLMEFGWKVLLPLALLNVFITALVYELFSK